MESSNASAILWDVVEEHLDEAEFLWGQVKLALDDPEFTLDEVYKGSEARLLAHLDGLVSGGPPVLEEYLESALDDIDPEVPNRAVVTVLALLLAGRVHRVCSAMRSAPDARHVLLRGCAWIDAPGFDEWLTRVLKTSSQSDQKTCITQIMAVRGQNTLDLFSILRNNDSAALLPALIGARRKEGIRQLPVIEHLLEHETSEVRSFALVTALHHDCSRAWQICLAQADSKHPPDLFAKILLAALGDRKDHEALVRQLHVPAHRPIALRALGFSGNITCIPQLITWLDAEDLNLAKLAAEAIATITGAHLEALVDQEAGDPNAPVQSKEELDLEGLPPFEEDDLDADLVPPPEASIPLPRRSTLADWLQTKAKQWDRNQRWIAGQPATLSGLINGLRTLSTRQRHWVGYLLSIRTQGEGYVNTWGAASMQFARLETLEKMQLRPKKFINYGRW